MTPRKAALLLTVLVLLILNVVLWALLRVPQGNLEVTFLNVGQGDAILIETPSGVQILIDGGPDRSILRQLPLFMGPLDRSIDLVVATHPDKDHIAGLADVFARYQVRAFMEPGIEGETSFAHALSYAVKHEPGVMRIEARRGMRIHLGKDAYADVLFPDRDVDAIESNTGSIVLRLVHGESEFMLTGDAPMSVEDWLVTLDGEKLRSDVLKAGHHGSRTSTGERWMETVAPRYVVISAGKDNSYGHPHEEVVERVRRFGAEMRSTMDGPVTFVSDGREVWVK